MVLYCVAKMGIYCFETSNRMARKVYYLYVATWLLAMAFWVADWALCKQYSFVWKTNDFGAHYFASLHGYWHVIIGINCYLAPLFTSLIRIETIGVEPKLNWFGPIPYAVPVPFDKRK
jgi:hypothetical protein